MATKTIRENFVNTFGTDLLMAYFDPGAGPKGGGRYNFACYSIADDNDWIKAIVALRAAACLFKLPIDASASVDIVMDTANPNVPTSFSVQIQGSSHRIGDGCKPPPSAKELSDESKAAVEQVHKAIKNATQSLKAESQNLTEAAAATASAEAALIPPPPTPTCSVSQPCGGRTTTTCIDPITTQAECIQSPTGEFQVVCVPRISPDPGSD